MVNMPKDGGISNTNKAGAKYGTGYCDSKCPRDLKFIAGMSNSVGWVPSSVSSGTGEYGSCCAEMDIWEANSISSAYTSHAGPSNLSICIGDSCGGVDSTTPYAGDTDPDGCDFNSYRQGNPVFYGPGKTVDTSKVITVVTQFLTDDGTATGNLNEIKRFYVQNGIVIPNSQSTVPGIAGNSIDNQYCLAQKQIFNNTDSFHAKGGFQSMTSAMKAGMVLVLGLSDDYASDMMWLDGAAYPADGNPATPGVARGACPVIVGLPVTVESLAPTPYVVFSNIKTGPINSTFAAAGAAKRSFLGDKVEAGHLQ